MLIHNGEMFYCYSHSTTNSSVIMWAYNIVMINIHRPKNVILTNKLYMCCYKLSKYVVSCDGMIVVQNKRQPFLDGNKENNMALPPNGENWKEHSFGFGKCCIIHTWIQFN